MFVLDLEYSAAEIVEVPMIFSSFLVLIWWKFVLFSSKLMEGQLPDYWWNSRPETMFVDAKSGYIESELLDEAHICLP